MVGPTPSQNHAEREGTCAGRSYWQERRYFPTLRISCHVMGHGTFRLLSKGLIVFIGTVRNVNWLVSRGRVMGVIDGLEVAGNRPPSAPAPPPPKTRGLAAAAGGRPPAPRLPLQRRSGGPRTAAGAACRCGSGAERAEPQRPRPRPPAAPGGPAGRGPSRGGWGSVGGRWEGRRGRRRGRRAGRQCHPCPTNTK